MAFSHYLDSFLKQTYNFFPTNLHIFCGGKSPPLYPYKPVKKNPKLSLANLGHVGEVPEILIYGTCIFYPCPTLKATNRYD